MKPSFIFTADDFGPIDFINRGICYAVNRGLVNSVHVLANGDKVQLRESLHQLNESVSEGSKVDIGLHLTLTSGKPVYKESGKSINGTWGKMLKKGSFKKYSQFYFGYDRKLDVIEGEFNAQFERLQDALAGIPNSHLQFTSMSHHHGIFAIDDVLFGDYYSALGHKNKLAIRNPKALPASSNNSFFGLVVPLFNLTDRKEDRKEMEVMNDAFGKNRFAGKKALKLTTPHYTDVSFYGSLGSLAIVESFKRKRIEKRIKAFNEILERATKYAPVPDSEPQNKVVEVVFHLGDHTQNKRGFKQAVKHYNGISPKYFEDRQHELFALEEVHEAKAAELKEALVSWTNCGEVQFKKL